MMDSLVPGIYDMPMAEYLALPALSSGMCQKLLAQSPLHAWIDSAFNPNREQDNSKVADIGTTMHDLLLGGEGKIVVINPQDHPTEKDGKFASGWTNKSIRAARDKAYAAGKTPILLAAHQKVELAVNAAREYVAHSEISGVFDSGKAEQTIIWEENGVLCKARPDWLTADCRVCLSYKTTSGTAEPNSWIRTQLPSYDVSTIFYSRAVASLGVVAQIVHLVQEQSDPFACSLIALAPSFEQLASRKLDTAIALWADCSSKNHWPAYPSRVCWAEPLPWQENQFLEREALRGDEHLLGGEA